MISTHSRLLSVMKWWMKGQWWSVATDITQVKPSIATVHWITLTSLLLTLEQLTGIWAVTHLTSYTLQMTSNLCLPRVHRELYTEMLVWACWTHLLQIRTRHIPASGNLSVQTEYEIAVRCANMHSQSDFTVDAPTQFNAVTEKKALLK